MSWRHREHLAARCGSTSDMNGFDPLAWMPRWAGIPMRVGWGRDLRIFLFGEEMLDP